MTYRGTVSFGAFGWVVAVALVAASSASVAQEGQDEGQGADEGAAQEDKGAEAEGEPGADRERTRRAPSDDQSYPEIDGLQIQSIVLAEGYENRQPVDETRTFARGRIFAVIDITNTTGEPAEVFVSWPEEGKRGGKGLTLEIPDQRRYRTVAMTWATPREPGSYRVLVRSAEGEKLGDKTFEISR